MTQTAQKRSCPPPVPSRDSRQPGSSPFGSRGRTGTLLPPPHLPSSDAVPVFLDLTALVNQADEGSETSASSGAHFVDVDGDNGQGDGDQPVQSEHAVVNASTVVPRGHGQGAPVSNAEPSLPAQFKTAPVAERAELQIEDLSLRFDNPYLPSSLVPPKRSRFGKGAIMVVAGAVVGAVATFAGGNLLQPASLLARNSERPAATSEVAISAAPAPVKPSAAREMQALPPVVVGAKASGVSSGGASSASTPMPPVTASEPPAQVKMAAAREVAKKPKSSMRRHGARRSRSAKPVPVSAEPAIVDAPASTPVVDASLPLAPAREEVVAVFGRLRAQIWRCAAGNKGVVEIQATITGEGRISNALIAGVFSGTPEGSCMARAVRAGSFSPFRQPKVTVSFPIAL